MRTNKLVNSRECKTRTLRSAIPIVITEKVKAARDTHTDTRGLRYKNSSALRISRSPLTHLFPRTFIVFMHYRRKHRAASTDHRGISRDPCRTVTERQDRRVQAGRIRVTRTNDFVSDPCVVILKTRHFLERERERKRDHFTEAFLQSLLRAM